MGQARLPLVVIGQIVAVLLSSHTLTAPRTSPTFSFANGNTEPNQGFGHVVVSVDSLEAACRKFKDAGLTIDEGPSKALVFITDPDGYKIGISGQGKANAQDDATDPASYRMSYTMLRIKDPHPSLSFYHEFLGMSLLRTVEHERVGLTLYYLGYTGASPQRLQSDKSDSRLGGLGRADVDSRHRKAGRQSLSRWQLGSSRLRPSV